MEEAANAEEAAKEEKGEANAEEAAKEEKGEEKLKSPKKREKRQREPEYLVVVEVSVYEPTFEMEPFYYASWSEIMEKVGHDEEKLRALTNSTPSERSALGGIDLWDAKNECVVEPWQESPKWAKLFDFTANNHCVVIVCYCDE